MNAAKCFLSEFYAVFCRSFFSSVLIHNSLCECKTHEQFQNEFTQMLYSFFFCNTKLSNHVLSMLQAFVLAIRKKGKKCNCENGNGSLLSHGLEVKCCVGCHAIEESFPVAFSIHRQ